MGPSMQKETWLSRRHADPKTLHACQNSRSDQGKRVEHCGGTRQRQTSVLRCEAIADHTDSQTVRRLPEMAPFRRVREASPGSAQWRERVAPPELMGGSSRTVLTSKQTSQILEEIGKGAEARTTSGNSAICETCTRRQIESVAEPYDRRIDPGGTPQERNPAEISGHDLEQDTETEAYTSESLTMRLRQVPQRRGEGQEKALACLTLTKSERKAPCKPRRRWRRSRRMQW